MSRNPQIPAIGAAQPGLRLPRVRISCGAGSAIWSLLSLAALRVRRYTMLLQPLRLCLVQSARRCLFCEGPAQAFIPFACAGPRTARIGAYSAAKGSVPGEV